jgi:uncharacterized repeat protein (TIGR01451 family)
MMLTAGRAARALPGDLILASTSDEGIKTEFGAIQPSLSADGTRVAFVSGSDILDPVVPVGPGIYVKDLATGDVVLASTSDDGIPGDNGFGAYSPTLSEDGTKVAFGSYSDNLDPGDHDAETDVFVKDVVSGDITLASVTAAGVDANHFTYWSTLSGDGTRVAFTADATNLDPADTDVLEDVYVKDLLTGELVLASTTADGVKGNGENSELSLSADGTVLAFTSTATNLDPADTDSLPDVYVKNLLTGEITLASTSDVGDKGNAGSSGPSLSADGTLVAFSTDASNLHPADADGITDVYVKSLLTGDVALASTSDMGDKGNGGSFSASLSADGTTVAFNSGATNLDPADPNGGWDVYVKSLLTGDVALASAAQTPGKGVRRGNGASFWPSLSADGARVAFQSQATNLVLADRDTRDDIYVKELGGPLPPGSDVAVSIASPDTAIVGRTLTSTMTVVDHGPDAASETTLTAVLPTGTTFVSISPSRGACTVSVKAHIVTCHLGILPAHTSASVALVVTPILAGTITITASVDAEEPDADTTNNLDARSVTVLAN